MALSFFQERLLDDTNTTDTPGQSPSSGGGNGVVGDEGPRGLGIILLAVVIVVALFVGWRSIKMWQARRERHALQVQSARADTVLGDMQVRKLKNYHAWLNIHHC